VLGPGDAPGVDKRTAAKLRRGLLPIEATLDLHGLGRETARDRLTAFVAGHHAAGRRCLLVVTGKGLKEDWSPGVIRSAVPGWLNEPPLRPLILTFATAQPQHGGSGAIYVLLKRAR
jgi:DNA-nicking Smr family endonuclease